MIIQLQRIIRDGPMEVIIRSDIRITMNLGLTSCVSGNGGSRRAKGVGETPLETVVVCKPTQALTVATQTKTKMLVPI